MNKLRHKRIVMGMGSLWPQPNPNPRQAYKFSYPNPDAGKPRPGKSNEPKIKTVVLSRSLADSIEQAQQIVQRLLRRRSGLDGGEQQRYADQAAVELSKHLEEFEQDLRAKGRDAKHVRQMAEYARAVLLGTPQFSVPNSGIPEKRKRGRQPVQLPTLGWVYPRDVILSRARRQVALVKEKRAAATANRYRDAAVEFFAWGVEDGRWPANPLARLERYSARADRRVVRRALPAEDFAHLIEVVETSKPVQDELPGPQRSLIYRTCVAAGLRANEARAVTLKDVILRGAHPGIWIAAEISKNGKREFVPLPAGLAAELSAAAAGRGPDSPLLGVLPTDGNTSRMIRRDLKRAGIPYKTAEGVYDFHALRHQCGALLLSAGANVKAVQQHMRHSNSQLTLDTYGHLLPDDREHARRNLLSFNKEERTELADRAQRKAQRDRESLCNEMLPNATPAPEAKERKMSQANEKPLPRGSGEEWSDGESNPDLLNAIQPSSPQNPPARQQLPRSPAGTKAQSAARNRPTRPRALQPGRPGRRAISLHFKGGAPKAEVLNILERQLTRPQS